MAAGGSRRSSTPSDADNPSRPVVPSTGTGSTPNIFDDGHATDYAESIMAPSETTENPFEDPPATPDLAENPFQPSENLPPALAFRERNSIRKSLSPRRQDSSSSLRRTDGGSRLSSQVGRSLSVASTFSFAAPQSPGASEYEPSHPYAMYPQVMGLSRSASLSASTIHRSSSTRSTQGRQGPTHPYNMYPQDVPPEGFEPALPTHEYVGFPGHGQRFHRLIGPEGEEQDIVGIDGHAEQLPPYSKYPIFLGRDGSTSTQNPAEARETASAQPETQDAPLQDSPDTETRPTAESMGGPSTLVQSEQSWSEKTWKEKSWKERGKIKICGCIPLRVIFFIAVVAIFITVVCGSAISRAIDGTKPEVVKYQTAADHYPATMSHNATVTSISYIDAASTTSAANMPPLPTGTFNVPLGVPDQTYNECLGQSQEPAWTCQLPAEQSVCVKLYQLWGRSVFSTCNDEDVILGYGTQPPAIYSQTLKLVSDLQNQTLGTAWHFQTFYDKLVIIPEHLLSAPAKQKRDLGEDQLPGPVEVGDQAWFCAWDDTFIEGFIYASVSNPASATIVDPSATFYSETDPITWPMTTKATQPTGSATSGLQVEDADDYSAESSTPLSYGSASPFPQDGPDGYYSAGSTYYAPSTLPCTSSKPGDERREVATPYSSATSSIHLPSSISSTSTTSTTPFAAMSSSSSYSTNASCIPKLVKFEERRLSGLHSTAVCTLMRKMDDLTFVTVNDKDEQPITVSLVEDDGPNGVNGKVKKWLGRGPFASGGGAALERRYTPGAPDETCFCQWSSEEFE